jgi:hypothetical protein
MNNAETQYTQASTDGFADAIKYSEINHQTVIEGVVSATGAADYIVGDGAALTAYATASTSNPLILSFAAGNSTWGGLNYDIKLTTDSTWAGLLSSSTNHLFFDTSTAGVITSSHTIIEPQYGYVFNDNIATSGYSTSRSLVHFDGAGGSTTATDEFGSTWTFFGTAMLSNSQFKFGTASLVLPGSSASYVETTNITSLGNNSWTMEGWFYLNSTANAQAVINSVSPFGFNIYYDSITGHSWLFLAGSTIADSIANESSGSITITSSAWHHWSLTYNSSTYSVWIDGALDQTVVSTVVVNSVLGGIRHGLDGGGGGAFNGFIDEFRFTRGIARYTSSFTPSTAAFTEEAYFYDLNKNIMYFGDATSFTEVNRLFVGNAVTDATVVTSVQAYDLKGRNTIISAALAVNQVQAFNHAMGLRPAVDVVLVNLSADAGYFPGDEVSILLNSLNSSFTIATDATTIRSLTGSADLSVNHKTTSTLTTITMTSWAFKFYLSRPFDSGVV